jgi:hypothetical protein
MMSATRRAGLWALAGATAALLAALVAGAGPAGVAAAKPDAKQAAAPAEQPGGGKPVTVAEARERAKLLHDVYAATLDALHHHFFRRDRAVLPARAMEDVFAAMDKKSGIKAGWISVNTKAMSINHEPKTDFEKQAAKALAADKGEFELTEKGYYRRAGAIPLGRGASAVTPGFSARRPRPSGRPDW